MDQVAPLVSQWLNQTKELELELRFGRVEPAVKNAFTGIHFNGSCLSRDHFLKLVQTMTQYNGWSSVEGWSVSVDACFEQNQRLTLRSSADESIVREDINMEKLQHRVFYGLYLPYCIRLTLKQEQAIKIAHNLQTAQLIRIKKRCRFVYKQLFAYDFTVVKTTSDWKQAETSPETLPETYEIEMELLHSPQLRDKYPDATSQRRLVYEWLWKAQQLIQQLSSNCTLPCMWTPIVS